jgi:hypothetical protein
MQKQTESIFSNSLVIKRLQQKISKDQKATALGNLFYEKLPGIHRCPSSLLAQREYTFAMGTVPKISVEGMSRVIPMIAFGWLKDLG